MQKLGELVRIGHGPNDTHRPAALLADGVFARRDATTAAGTIYDANEVSRPKSCDVKKRIACEVKSAGNSRRPGIGRARAVCTKARSRPS